MFGIDLTVLFLAFIKKTTRNTMLQRIQTIYLLVSIIFFGFTNFFPIASGNLFELYTYGIFAIGGEPITEISTYYFILPMALAAGLTVLAIFLFNNRKNQMAVVRLTFVLYAISFALLAFCIKDCQQLLVNDESMSLRTSFYTPFISLLLNMLALRAIRKDDKLIRSVDRIR